MWIDGYGVLAMPVALVPAASLVSKNKQRSKERRILNDAFVNGSYAFLYDAMLNTLLVTKGACYIYIILSELHTLQKAFTNAGGRWSTFLI